MTRVLSESDQASCFLKKMHLKSSHEVTEELRTWKGTPCDPPKIQANPSLKHVCAERAAMALQVRGDMQLWNKVRGSPRRLTWNGGCDRWLDGVGLLHEGLDTGDRRMES